MAHQSSHARAGSTARGYAAEEKSEGMNGDQGKYTVDSIGPRIESFLDALLDDADFDLDFEIVQGEHAHPDLEDPDVVVRFTGPDVDILLSNRAELLLALEQLTMEMLRMPAEDHSLLCFDANDYRILRIEELRMSAITAAERVKASGRPFHFSPMSSRERRIIHLSLRSETEVRSESTGTGPIRQVVVVPSGMQTLPAPVIPPRPREDAPRGDDRRGGRGGRDRDRRSGPPRRRP
jgi:spoIIIJ-associated protein